MISKSSQWYPICNGSENDEKNPHDQFEIHNVQVDCAASAMETIQLLTTLCGLLRIYEVIHSQPLSIIKRQRKQAKQVPPHRTYIYLQD